MSKETKPFTPYPTRPIRMSDKTWNELKVLFNLLAKE